MSEKELERELQRLSERYDMSRKSNCPLTDEELDADRDAMIIIRRRLAYKARIEEQDRQFRYANLADVPGKPESLKPVVVTKGDFP